MRGEERWGHHSVRRQHDWALGLWEGLCKDKVSIL